jgi:hypothetical protein
MASTQTTNLTNSNDTRVLIAGLGGSLIIYGLAGIDTLSLGTSVKADYFIINSSNGAVQVDTVSGASSPTYLTLKNMEVLTFNDKHDFLGIGGNSVAFFDGINNISFWGKNANTLPLSQTPTGYKALATDGTGLFTFENINRIQFKDKSIALDFANNGNATLVAKTLVAVFGASTVTQKPEYVGIGLKFLDQDVKTSSAAKFSDIMALALSAAMPNASNQQIVDLLYSNVVGPHTSQQAAPYVLMLDQGTLTVASLGVMAADLVNLTAMGLPQSGLPFTGYTL